MPSKRKYYRKPKFTRRPTVSRNALLTKFLNPFIGGKPKYLDGGKPYSAVVNRAISFEVNVGAGNSAAILLAPGITSPCIIQTPLLELTGDETNNETINFNSTVKRWDLDEVQINCNNTEGYREPGNGNSEAFRGRIETEIASWRLVNQGMKISLLNESDANDGWFEAYRVSDRPGLDELMMFRDAGGTGGTWNVTNFYLGISGQYIAYKAMSQYRQNQKTYITGPLKQLGKYLFALQPTQFSHPYIDIPEYHAGHWRDWHEVGNLNWWYNRHANPWSGVGGGQDDVATWALTEGAYKMVDKLYDLSHDMIMVIVHAGANGSKCLVSLAGHHEVSYKTTSPKQRFETPTTINLHADRAIYNARSKKRMKI